jgi:hypothetical protein
VGNRAGATFKRGDASRIVITSHRTSGVVTLVSVVNEREPIYSASWGRQTLAGGGAITGVCGVRLISLASCSTLRPSA